MDSSTASRIEQRKEIDREIPRTQRRVVIEFVRLPGYVWCAYDTQNVGIPREWG